MALAERVTATLKFVDGNGQKAPIRRATVEIWRKYGSFIPVWHDDFTVTTDESGRIDFTVPPSADVGPGAVYGLRVYATNDAAIVRFRDRPQDAMYAQPGPPGAAIQLVSNSPSDVLDFSWDFIDPATAAYYNIADALLYGRDYALARRAPGETEMIKQVTVSVQPDTGDTYYNPAVHWIRINPGTGYAIAMDDFTILHEYGHFLEDQLSSFMALATVHDGCNAQLGSGDAHVESLDFAWMEGSPTTSRRRSPSPSTPPGATRLHRPRQTVCSTVARRAPRPLGRRRGSAGLRDHRGRSTRRTRCSARSAGYHGADQTRDTTPPNARHRGCVRHD